MSKSEIIMWYLFLGCFLSATMFPIPSEGFVFFTLFKGYNPFWILIFASLGNCLGSAFTYFTGVICEHYIIKKYFNKNDTKIKKAQERILKYKSPILLLSWLPGIGDPMVMASGIMRINFLEFMCYTFTGRIIRYIVLIGGFVLYSNQRSAISYQLSVINLIINHLLKSASLVC